MFMTGWNWLMNADQDQKGDRHVVNKKETECLAINNQ
jgi:hypothetical protein